MVVVTWAGIRLNRGRLILAQLHNLWTFTRGMVGMPAHVALVLVSIATASSMMRLLAGLRLTSWIRSRVLIVVIDRTILTSLPCLRVDWRCTLLSCQFTCMSALLTVCRRSSLYILSDQNAVTSLLYLSSRWWSLQRWLRKVTMIVWLPSFRLLLETCKWNGHSFWLDVCRGWRPIVHQDPLRSHLWTRLKGTMRWPDMIVRSHATTIWTRIMSWVLIVSCCSPIWIHLRCRLLIKTLEAGIFTFGCWMLALCNRIFLSKSHRFGLACLSICSSCISGLNLCPSELCFLSFHSVNELEHKAHFPINCCVWCKEFLDLKGSVQIKNLCKHSEHILHKGIVVLSNQTILALILDKIGNGTRVNQKDEVDRWQVDTGISRQDSNTIKVRFMSFTVMAWLTCQLKYGSCTSKRLALAWAFGFSSAATAHFFSLEVCFAVRASGTQMLPGGAKSCGVPDLVPMRLVSPCRSEVQVDSRRTGGCVCASSTSSFSFKFRV